MGGRVFRRGQRVENADRGDHPVPTSTHPGDVAGRVWVVCERIAHQFHALTDCLLRDDESRPHALNQLIERHEIWCGASEREKKLERELGERQLDVPAHYPLAADIEP